MNKENTYFHTVCIATDSQRNYANYGNFCKLCKTKYYGNAT